MVKSLAGWLIGWPDLA